MARKQNDDASAAQTTPANEEKTAQTEHSDALGIDSQTDQPSKSGEHSGPAQTVEAEKRPRLGEQVLFCPYHDPPVRMESRKSEGAFTRYYCMVKGCKYSVKVPRPRIHAHVERQRRTSEQDLSARE